MYKSYQQDENESIVESGVACTPRDGSDSTGRLSKGFKYGLAVLATAVFVFAVSLMQKPEVSQGVSSQLFSSGSLTDSAGDVITISISTPGYDALSSLSMLPWDTIAEPYKVQDLEISSVVLAEGKHLDLSKLTVEWDMCYNYPDLEFTLIGVSTSFQANFTAVCNCSVTVFQSREDFAETLDFTMAVKYVRREIRSLSDDDRNSFLTALNLMYTLSSEEGQALYGSKFHNADYYSAKHLNGAGVSDCDHWHDGAGLLVHHMAFTLMVEQTLQSINPALAIPYWEYGMDPYLYDQWEDSPIFGADWFGEEPSNSDHTIQDGGMWQGIGVGDGAEFGSGWSIADTGSVNPFKNAYGQLRSPWNNNPNTLLSRHNQTYGMTQYYSMPTCKTLQSCFESDSLADLNGCTNGATHGPVHILIGGAWHEGSVFKDVAYVRNPAKLLFFKVLWRMGWTRCPTNCSTTDDDGNSCKCSIPDEYLATYGAEYILKDTNIYYAEESNLNDATDAEMLKVLRACEDPGIIGDFYSSAAAFDPIFWPLHGSAERLVSLKRIYVSLGESASFDPTWGFPAYDKYSSAAYLDGVCDWSAITDPYTDLTLPNCTMGKTCYGHGEYDILDFSSFISNETYTNVEFFDFIHPWNDDLPYVYETYDFDFCANEGYTFDPYAEAMPVMPHDNPTTTTGAPQTLYTGVNPSATGSMSTSMATGTMSMPTTAGVMPTTTASSGTPSMPLNSMTTSTTQPGGKNNMMFTGARASSAKTSRAASIRKSDVKELSAARSEEMAAKERANVPLDVVTPTEGHFATYASLQEYSESTI